MIKEVKVKLIKMIGAAALCFSLFAVIITVVQTRTQIESQGVRSEAKLRDTIAVINDRAAQAELEYQEYDNAMKAKVKAVAYMVQNKPGYVFSTKNLQKLCQVEGIAACWIIDCDGKIRAASDPDDETDFTIRRFTQLRDGFAGGVSEPFTIEWDSVPLRYCGARLDENRMFVIAEDPTNYNAIIENITSVENNISNITIGSNGFVFSINRLTNTVETYPGNELLDASAYELGLTPENLQNGFKGIVKINGTNYFCVTNAESPDRYLLAVVPYSEMTNTNIFMVISSLIILLIAIILLVAYGIMVWNNGLNHPELMEIAALKKRKKFVNKYLLRKVLPVAVTIFAMIFLISFYLQTLYFISNTAVSNNELISDIRQTLDGYDEDAELLNETYNQRYLEMCRIGAYIVEQCPELLTNADISDIGLMLNVKNVYYFNVDGKSTVSSASQGVMKLSEDTNAQSYAFWSVLSGTQEYYIQEMTIDDTGTLNQYIGVAVYDENNVVMGMFQIALSDENRQMNLSLLDITASLASIKVGNNGIVFSVDKETKAVTYHPDETLMGKSAYALGMTDNDFKDNYSDFISFDNEKYFASSSEHADNYVYVAIPEWEIGRTKLVIVGLTLLTAAVIFIILIYILVIGNRDDTEEIKRAVIDKDEDSVYFSCIRPDGTVSTLSSAESRFSLQSLKWVEKTPEQKLFAMVRWIFSIIAVLICVVIWLHRNLFYSESESILDYIINGGWENSLNIFALTNVLIMVMFVNTVAVLLRKLFMLIARSSGQRGETIGRLMCGIIKYAAIILCIFNGLRIFGVDTSTLMTSAGLLSLIVGFGSQSLIGDLVAGLFIVFEGEFRVGDIVTIDGWRGTVMEIGLRTTKIEDGTHNIKIFNNSKISGVINMTQKYSVAFCDVGVEYGESIERVEEVLKRELPHIREAIPEIEREPQFLGITGFGDSSVDIRIMAECPENVRVKVERALRREVKLIFDRNNIGIPFPQIVINQPESFEAANKDEEIK